MNGSELYQYILNNTSHELRGTWEVTQDNELKVTGTNVNGSYVVFPDALTNFSLEWEITVLVSAETDRLVNSGISPILLTDPTGSSIEGWNNGTITNAKFVYFMCNWTGSGDGNVGTLKSISDNGSMSNVNSSTGSFTVGTKYTYKLVRANGYLRLYQDNNLISEYQETTYADTPFYLGWYMWWGGTYTQYQANFIIDNYVVTDLSTDTTKYLNGTGLSEVWTNTKNYISAQLLGKSDVGHTHSASDITSGLATVATSGSYNDLSNKPAIPTVNDATLTIQKNGSNVATFTANASSDVTCNITVPTKTSDLTNDSGFLTSHQDLSDYVTLNDAQTIPGNKTFSGLTKTTGKLSYSYLENDLNNAIYNMETAYWGPDTANKPSTSYCGTLLSLNCEGNVHTSNGIGWIAQLGISTDLRLYLRTKTNLEGAWENWKEFISKDEAVPRSGGTVITGTSLAKMVNSSFIDVAGGTGWSGGGSITLYGKDNSSRSGSVTFTAHDGTSFRQMTLAPDGTWTWTGQAVQLVSDQRLKQQITEIDNKLLDAWEDVNLVQFKYNDAVKEKSDNARLHTGYVVQQIDDACKSHGVDVSEYGLYCHEVYQEETREVENEDGTKTVEVVRPANEHYSLRYTEALIVECAFLRKKLKELIARIEQLEKGNNVK